MVQGRALHPGHCAQATDGGVAADANAGADSVCKRAAMALQLFVDLSEPAPSTDPGDMRVAVHADVSHVCQVDRDIGIVCEVGVGVTPSFGLNSKIMDGSALNNLGNLLSGMRSYNSPRIDITVMDIEPSDPVDLIDCVACIGDAMRLIAADVVQTGFQWLTL